MRQSLKVPQILLTVLGVLSGPAGMLHAQYTPLPQHQVQTPMQAQAPSMLQAQPHATQDQFSISNVFRDMQRPTVANAIAANDVQPLWWDQHVATAQRDELPNMGTDLHTLMYLALKYSNQIRIAAEDPLIRQTAIAEADSNFDWARYVNSSWEDTSQPTSNQLIAGPNVDRFEDQIFQVAAGVRRNTRTGGLLDISQRFGYQDNNSEFFVPGDQATGQLTLSYSQPLLRGRGLAYNNSLVLLAQIDSEVAMDEFRATLQDHLLEVARAYWLLYQERAVLAQQVKLFLKTQQVVDVLKERQGIDAQRTQYVLASSALATRRSDLIRSRTAVINAETRLRGLINAPELSNSDQVELVPSEFPTLAFMSVDLQNEIQISLQNRPEVHAAIKQIRAGATRLGIAQHELLPALNLVTQVYANGLRGNSDFSQAFGDQFTDGRPSYSLGLNYEVPVGNRLAKARLCRRQIELRQLERQYAQALQAIQVEVDIAVREMLTSQAEVKARRLALKAAEAEATTIEARWRNLIGGSGTSSLNLESLLDAQERVTQAEGEYVTSLLTLNLASINLRKANGTLLQSENVAINKACDGNCQGPIQLDKFAPSNQSQAQYGQSQMEFYQPQMQVSPVVSPGSQMSPGMNPNMMPSVVQPYLGGVPSMEQGLSNATDRAQSQQFSATEKTPSVPAPKWTAPPQFEAAQTSFVDRGQTAPQQTSPPRAQQVSQQQSRPQQSRPQQSLPPYHTSFFDDSSTTANQNQVDQNVWDSQTTP